MSLIPYITQMGAQTDSQGSQCCVQVVLVFTDDMTERQSSLMDACNEYLKQNLGILPRKASDLDLLPPKMRFFVIPSQKEDLLKKIRSHFEKPIIYLPRAVIEARSYYRVNLPVRTLAISLTMHNCRIFLVRSCDTPSIRNRIHEMCGTIVSGFNDNPNVVITDKADNKYCSRALKQNIPVVPRDWIDENYSIALEEEDSYFNHNAASTLKEHQIKPFHGLYFKIIVKNSGAQIKKLITDNQGHIIYGNENCLTHIVGPTDCETDSCSDNQDSNNKEAHKPKRVDIDFLKLCVDYGYHISKREYREYKINSGNAVKKERLTPPRPTPPLVEENFTPPQQRQANGYNGRTTSENQTMLPPPSAAPRSLKQQPGNMNDMILKALSTFETAQTQLASTQMRRLPDPELRIEQTFEPSQQLFWNDSASRRN